MVVWPPLGPPLTTATNAALSIRHAPPRFLALFCVRPTLGRRGCVGEAAVRGPCARRRSRHGCWAGAAGGGRHPEESAALWVAMSAGVDGGYIGDLPRL